MTAMTDDQALRHLIATWKSATHAGDTATVLSLMTDDVVFLVPGREPFGKAFFLETQAAVRDAHIESANDILELEVFGDFAYVRSHLAVTVTLPSGKILERAGSGLAIFRKENGAWRLARDANLLTDKA